MIENGSVSEAIAGYLIRQCDPRPKCSITQDIKVTLLAQQIIENIMTVISNNKSVNDLVSKYERDVSVKNTNPITEFFDGISKLFGQFAWIVIAIIVAVLIGIIGLAYFLTSEGGQKVVNSGLKTFSDSKKIF